MVKIVKFAVGILLQLKKQNTDNIECWRGYRTTGMIIHCYQERKMQRILWKTVGNSYKAKHALMMIQQ